MSKRKGFTLIELLIVIAIIGILATLISSFLGSARNQSQDSAIQSELKSLQSQIAITVTGGSYENIFDGDWSSPDEKIQGLLGAIANKSAFTMAASSPNAWAAQAQSASDPSKYFCVDATGVVTESNSANSSGETTCP